MHTEEQDDSAARAEGTTGEKLKRWAGPIKNRALKP